MSDPSSTAPIELAFPDDDLVLPFQAEQADVLGRLVKLGPTVDTILSRHAYPEPVSRLLGEAVALTALLGASLKSDGKLILQTTTDGPVDLLVADYLVPGALRGYARFDAERLAALDTDDDAALLGQGHLAMTIDRGLDTERYQGVVPLEGESLTEAADTYFRQSEQLPTFIRLAVARHYRAGEGGDEGAWTWRAGGLLVQKLTREGGVETPKEFEEDWSRAKMLAETVEDHELLDPLLPPDRLVYRLFHEETVRAYRHIPLETYCSCSRERVEELLTSFSAEDLADMIVDGKVGVTCEFCNARYDFDPETFNTE
ncbi:MAG: Hsp33 family molecular chaperone [Alphaproteobacteria bacterium]